MEPSASEPVDEPGSKKPQQIIVVVLVALVGVAVLLGVLLAGEGDSEQETLPAPSEEPSPTPAMTAGVEKETAPTPTVTPVTSESELRFEVGMVEILGESLPPDETVGHKAPAFRAQPNTSQEMIEIKPDDGTVRLIGFFAHWCPHCQREVPRVVNWLSENEIPEGIKIVAISTSVREGTPNYPPSEWFESENWPTQVLVDSRDGEIAAAYGLTGFPFWVLVDGSGEVIHRSSGELSEEQFGYLVHLAESFAPQIA